MNVTVNGQEHVVFLCDDGTLDTVISIDGKEHRFDCEYASQFRTEDGTMDAKGLHALAVEAIENGACEE